MCAFAGEFMTHIVSTTRVYLERDLIGSYFDGDLGLILLVAVCEARLAFVVQCHVSDGDLYMDNIASQRACFNMCPRHVSPKPMVPH